MANPKRGSWIMAPELPIGSPEREAYFKELRKTFAEDWDAAAKSLARAREIAKGDLYFIRCGDAVKIGRTTNIVERLRNMQVNSPHEIDCLLLLRGQGKHEAACHKRFAAYRVRGEWFRLSDELNSAIVEAREANRTTTLSFLPMFAAVL